MPMESAKLLEFEPDQFKEVNEWFTKTKKEIYSKYTKVFINALNLQNFRDFRYLNEIDAFLDVKNSISVKKKVYDLRFLLDKFYCLYSNWTKFFPSMYEDPASAKKFVINRSRFFSQLLRFFENSVKSVVSDLDSVKLEKNTFEVLGSFNFVNVGVEHQLRLVQKLRKMDRYHMVTPNTQKKAVLAKVFDQDINCAYEQGMVGGFGS